MGCLPISLGPPIYQRQYWIFIFALALASAFMSDAFEIPSTSLAAEPPTEAPSGELELMKEEETVSIAARHEQPISEAPADVYVITDEDIRHSGAIDLPTVLRRIPGMEIMQMTGGGI